MIEPKKARFNKALLINPPTGLYDRYERCQALTESESVNIIRPPLDLMYLAAICRKQGVEAVIRDYPAQKAGWQDVGRDIASLRPDLLLASLTLATCREDMRSFTIAKQFNNLILTVAKGVFTRTGEELFAHYPEMDLLLRQEPEAAWEELLAGKPIDETRGLTWRKGNTGVVNPPRQTAADLDYLPFPERDLTNNSLYRMPDNGRKMGLVLTSKGCPFSCTFCLAPLADGRSVRKRSPASVANELEECVKKYGINDFWLRADCFTLDKRWVMEICRRIIGRGLAIRWATNGRVDNIDEEMLIAMKGAGCFALGFGIESGSTETLQRIRKGITKEQSRLAVRLCRKLGIQSYLFFIIGFPWERESHIMDTLAFAEELDGDIFNFSLAVPFPGTPLFAEAKDMGLLAKEGSYADFNYASAAMDTLYVKRERLAQLERMAYRRLMLRPSYIMRQVGKIRSYEMLGGYLKSAWHMSKMLF